MNKWECRIPEEAEVWIQWCGVREMDMNGAAQSFVDHVYEGQEYPGIVGVEVRRRERNGLYKVHSVRVRPNV